MKNEIEPPNNQFNFQGMFLGGFQVFDEITYIPFRRITLLFGPNSAGKSAVEDALKVLQELFPTSSQKSDSRYGPLGMAVHAFRQLSPDCEAFERLSRHWRRTGEENSTYAPRVTVGGRFASECALGPALADGINRDYRDDKENVEDYPDYPFIVDVLFGFNKQESEDLQLYATRDFSISVGGQVIAEFREGEYLRVNFTHPILAPVVPEVHFVEAAAKYPDIFQFQNGSVALRFDSDFGSFVLDNSNRFDPSRLIDVLRHSRKWIITQELVAALDEFALFYNELYGLIVGNISFSLSHVPASRTIPCNRDLQFLMEPMEPDLHQARLGGFDLGKIIGDPQYFELAYSIASSARQSSDVSAIRNQDSLLGEKVNRMLSEYLFIERGYQVASDYRLLLSEYDAVPPISEDCYQLVRLFLKDAQERTFSFGEVGSGLGYVLPVLCAVGEQSNSFVLLQQPELHLHPALQSALGDVFVEYSSKENQLVIETHSEHLLLRLLKRIRQTQSSQPIAAELQLRADDVSVLYFDPLQDGTTRVARLRISNDGEFMDRWPHGFFAERDRELFDE